MKPDLLQTLLTTSREVLAVVDEELYNKRREKFADKTYFWLNPILEGNSGERIIVMHDEFVLVKDFRYESTGSKRALNEIHYVLWFKNSQIKSIRDLDQSHIELVKKAVSIRVLLSFDLHFLNKIQIQENCC